MSESNFFKTVFKLTVFFYWKLIAVINVIGAVINVIVFEINVIEYVCFVLGLLFCDVIAIVVLVEENEIVIFRDV